MALLFAARFYVGFSLRRAQCVRLAPFSASDQLRAIGSAGHSKSLSENRQVEQDMGAGQPNQR
jgi:hypothetical protein